MRKRATRAVQMAEHWRAHSHLQKEIERVALEKEDKNIQKVQPVGLVKKDIVDRPQDKANEDEKERCCDGQKWTKPIEKRHGWVFTLAYLAFGLLFTLVYLAGYQVRHTGSMQMEDHDKGIKIQIEIVECWRTWLNWGPNRWFIIRPLCERFLLLPLHPLEGHWSRWNQDAPKASLWNIKLLAIKVNHWSRWNQNAPKTSSNLKLLPRRKCAKHLFLTRSN